MNVPFFSVKDPPRVALEEVANHLMWRYRANHVGIDDAWEDRQATYGVHEYGLMVDDLKKAGTEVMTFVLPGSYAGYDKPLPTDADDPSGRLRNALKNDEQRRANLTAELAQRGVVTYYARGFFKDKGPEDQIYRDDGVHLETAGHHAYAEYLDATIQAKSRRFQQWRTSGSSAEKKP
jgi:hypothetical protein